MTPEQMAAEIDRLRAELAEERAERRRVTETLRVMIEAKAKQEAAEAERKTTRRARNDRHRTKASSETSHETRAETFVETFSPPSPPLDGSPLLPAPILPSPLSSPHPPVSASQGSADASQQPGERPPLTLTTQDANPQPKQRAPRKPSAAEELYQQVQEVRRQQCEKAGVPYTPDYMSEARQNKELGPVVRVPPGAEVDEEGRPEAFRRFGAAFGEYLSDERHKDKGWPLALFLTGTVRARYEQAAALTAQASLAEVGT